MGIQDRDYYAEDARRRAKLSGVSRVTWHGLPIWGVALFSFVAGMGVMSFFYRHGYVLLH